jgi:GT2 family glycosyltransferase
VNNQSELPETFEFLRLLEQQPRVRVLNFDRPYNYAQLNNWAVRQTEAPLVAFVNNDVEVISPDWLTEMVSHALRPSVGAVGAKLYYPNGTIQHAGVVVGIGGRAGHPHWGLRPGEPGYFGRAVVTQQFSAVTAACMVMRRDVFLEIGGFDETRFAVAFNDIDLGLRLSRAGYSVTWTPYAELKHHESASLGPSASPERQEQFEQECRTLRECWPDAIVNDPFYNPNLTITGGDFSLSFPPRVRKPWNAE